jgi:hypothetical protein
MRSIEHRSKLAAALVAVCRQGCRPCVAKDATRARIEEEQPVSDDTTAAAAATGEHPAPARRSTAPEIAQAIDLGWRVAALHALRPRTLEPLTTTDDTLLNRRSLSAADRLELEVRAIAGVAARATAPLDDAGLYALLALARQAPDSDEAEQAFRDELASRHVAIEKQLWATHEPSGKAYELGNFLSDTWNRVLRPKLHPDPHTELGEIFGEPRVKRMTLLLDDLQARVDPVAAHAVSNHLETWCDRVATAQLREERAAATDGADADAVNAGNVARLEPIERQTIIWRQMLTGDKEPEAWIGRAERAQARDEFASQLWRRHRHMLIWAVPGLIVLGASIGWIYLSNKDAAAALAGTAFAVLGAFGATRASMLSALRRGAQNWGDLMWNRSLAVVICRATSLLDELYPPPPPPPKSRFQRLWNG